jgi:hypothetical protein
VTNRSQFDQKSEQSAWDTYCLRCGFDKRWPAPECDHKGFTFLRSNTLRLLRHGRPLVLDGLYNRRNA